MYKFTPVPPHLYSESPQANPLRWQILLREGDTFHPQTRWFMCKDYLSDVVAQKHDWWVVAYGLDTRKMKFNTEGLYLLLKGIMDIPTFCSNVEACVNKESDADPLTMEEVDGNILMYVPEHYLQNTYLISAMSWVIRVSNCKVKFKDLDDLLKSPQAQADHAPSGHGKEMINGWRFSVPEEFQQYWLYYRDNLNSKVQLDTLMHGSSVHNCGVAAWASGLSAAQRQNLKETA